MLTFSDAFARIRFLVAGSSRKRRKAANSTNEGHAPKKISVGAPPVSERIRQAARDRIQKVLEGNSLMGTRTSPTDPLALAKVKQI